MKVSVNIDAIGDDINSLVRDKLRERGLPECLGNMCPPIVCSVAELEDTSIFSNRKTTPPENIVMSSVLPLLNRKGKANLDSNSMYTMVKDLVLDVNGEKLIKAHKEDLSDLLVDKLQRCVNCKYTEICNQLTTHYLKTIYLKETL